MKKILLSILLICPLLSVFGCSQESKIETIEISTVEDLLLLQSDVPANYVLTNDIDCGGKQFAGVTDFCGTIDGQGYVIKNVEFISDNNEFGLIKNTKFADKMDRSNIFIKNIGIEDFVINANYTCNNLFVGAFIAFDDIGYDFTQCYSKGSINVQEKTKEDAFIGGLVGFGNFYNEISNCYSDADINIVQARKNTYDDLCVGGLIGGNDTGRRCIIENCYFSGSINYQSSYNISHRAIIGGAGGLINRVHMKNFVCLADEIYCYYDGDYVGPFYGGTYEKITFENNYYCGYQSELDYEKSNFSFNFGESSMRVNLPKNRMASKEFLLGQCSSYNEFGEPISIPCDFSEEIWNLYEYEEGTIKYPTLKVFD